MLLDGNVELVPTSVPPYFAIKHTIIPIIEIIVRKR